MHDDDVMFFLVTPKRDLVVKILQEFKRNIVHIKQVCWIALMQDDVTKFPLNAKVRLGGDQNQVVTVTVDFSFCRISNRHVRYVLYSSPRNLYHQVSF